MPSRGVEAGDGTDVEARLVAEAPVPGVTAFSRRPLAMCGGFVVLAAVAGMVAVAPGKMGGFGRAPQKVRNILDPSQLWINENLSISVKVEPYNLRQELQANIQTAWENFVTSTGIQEELTEPELRDYQTRFVMQVEAACKNSSDLARWEAIVADALEDEKPAATAQLQKAFEQVGGHTFHIRVKPWMEHISSSDVRMKCGATEGPPPGTPVMNASVAQVTGRRLTAYPAEFDSATEWPDCADVINRIHNQGTCGSCWAFAVGSSLDSRLCIATKGGFQAQLSRTYITSCAKDRGCQGGHSGHVNSLMAAQGAPTGGHQGCLAYFAHGDGTQHFAEQDSAPPCSSHCTNHGYFRSLEEDRLVMTEVKGAPWMPIARGYGYPVPADWFERIKESIMDQGPIPIQVKANDNLFFSYFSGIYDKCCVDVADHAMTMTGWGVDSQDGEFVKIMNSWGEWGIDDTGFMKAAPCVLCAADLPNRVDGDKHADKIDGMPGSDPVPAPPPPPDDNCQDSPHDWFYWDDHYNCAWWAGEGYCKDWAADYIGTDGKSALEACCACGGGTTANAAQGGDHCVFPFIFHGRTYLECTSDGTEPLWCATKVNPATLVMQAKAPCIHEGPTPATPVFHVRSGPCQANEQEGCIYREWYNNNEACTISVNKDVKLYSHIFATELFYDSLTINGMQYSGNGWFFGPDNIKPTADIVWTSDSCTPSEGWKICTDVP